MTIFNAQKHSFWLRERFPFSLWTYRMLWSAFHRRPFEKHAHYGNENPDKNFYVIGMDCGPCGLITIMKYMVMHCDYAIRQGWIPVVDMQNFPNQYNYNYADNAWEYYFMQPAGYSLADIAASRNIFFCIDLIALLNLSMYKDNNLSIRVIFFKTAFKKYIRYNAATERHLTDDAEYFIKGNKILGVLCRGTDYLHKKPEGHRIQPEPKDVIAKSMQVMSEYGCEYLFLASEDAEIYALFKEKFGSKLLSLEQRRFSKQELDGMERLSQIAVDRQTRYMMGLKYLSALNILSRCDCLIGGWTAGTEMVYIMKETQFLYDYIYDIGKYPAKPPSMSAKIDDTLRKVLFKRE
jgi:hypothetical protein